MQFKISVVMKRINRRLPDNEQLLTLRTANSAAIGFVLMRDGVSVRLFDYDALEKLAKDTGAIAPTDSLVVSMRSTLGARKDQVAYDFAFTLRNLTDDLTEEGRAAIFALAIKNAPALAPYLVSSEVQLDG